MTMVAASLILATASAVNLATLHNVAIAFPLYYYVSMGVW